VAKAPSKDSTAREELEKLIERADRGDTSVLPALREAVSPETWKQVGDLALQARQSLVRALSGTSEFTREAVNRRLREMREELALPSDGMLERLILDQVSSSWLALHYAEAIRGQNMNGLTIAQADFHDRRVTQCQKRYLAAIKALAQVRRLARPSIQVNIAEKQLNMA